MVRVRVKIRARVRVKFDVRVRVRLKSKICNWRMRDYEIAQRILQTGQIDKSRATSDTKILSYLRNCCGSELCLLV